MKLLTPLSRRVLTYLRPYTFPYMGMLVVAMIVSSTTDGAIPLLIKHFTDQIYQLKSVQLEALRVVSLELVAVFVLRSLSGFGEDYLSAYIGQHITLDIRSGLNRRLQRMSLSFFNRTPSGMMMSRVVNDVSVISNGITDGAFSVIGEGARLIFVLGAAFWIDWKLALIAFVVFPCAVGPVLAFSRRMRPRRRHLYRDLQHFGPPSRRLRVGGQPAGPADVPLGRPRRGQRLLRPDPLSPSTEATASVGGVRR